MYTSNLFAILGGIALTQANPLKRDGPFAGVATFNDYADQFSKSGTVCGIPKPANENYFGAAASDISGQISAGSCDGTIQGDQKSAPYNMKLCDPADPTKPISNYIGPSCPHSQCPDVNPTCYRVDNLGEIAPVGQTPALGSKVVGSVTVQIIDACPAGSAWNFCKNNAVPEIDPRQRCASAGTNELDIDEPAYEKLTGSGFVKGVSRNLDILITKVDC